MAKWPDTDLWVALQKEVARLPGHYVVAKWMPSHLDDPKRADVKKRAMAEGIIAEVDIRGNVGADTLANQGREMRPLPDHLKWRLRDRAFITSTVQRYMLQVWKHFEANGKMAAGTDFSQLHEADDLDMQWLDSAMMAEQEYADDEDVFGAIGFDFDGDEPQQLAAGPAAPDGGSVAPAPPQDDADVVSRYPGYLFDSTGPDDPTVTFPSDRALPYHKLAATTARLRPSPAMRERAPHHMPDDCLVSARIPYNLWGVLISWLSVLRWPTADGSNGPSTWLELCIAFAAQTSFAFEGLDLADALAVFSAAARKLITTFNMGAKLKTKARVSSALPILGWHLPGCSRRPILDKGLWVFIAEQMQAARDACNSNQNAFGVGYKMIRPVHMVITFADNTAIAADIAAAAQTTRRNNVGEFHVPWQRPVLNHGPCAFGCRITSKAWHHLPRNWIQVRGELLANSNDGVGERWSTVADVAQLCEAHYLEITRLIRSQMRPALGGSSATSS